MGRRRRISVLLLLLLAVVGVKLGQELYRWVAFADERALIRPLREEVVEVGVEVVRTRARADTLRTRIEADDRALVRERLSLEQYLQHARGDALPGHLYNAYRVDLETYNRHIAERNERVRAWRDALARNARAVDRYNLLADSLRALATRVGDPYYAVPLPAEAALERGLHPGGARPPAPRS